MKKLLSLLILTVILTACVTNKKIAKKNANAPVLDDVIQYVQHQYKEALDTLEKSGEKTFKLDEAEISLKVTKTTATEASLKVLIFTPKLTRSTSSATTVTYKLSRQKDQAGGGIGIIANKNQLRDAIIATAKSFNSSNSILGDLTKESFTIDIVFSVEKDASGAISFEVWGLGADFGANRINSVEQELTLTFKPVGK